MTRRIKVTLGHIAKGCRSAASDCPVYHALVDHDLKVLGVYDTIELRGQSVKTPPHVFELIKAYDNSGIMSPL